MVEYDVFLSYNSADRVAVEVLNARLRGAGINPFLDRWHLIPGEPFQSSLAEALEDSSCVAFFVGPAGSGPWHHEEMQYALNKAARTRNDYRVIPVLLPGSDLSQINGFLGMRTAVDFRAGLDDEAAFQRLVAGIQGRAPNSAQGLLELPDEPRPYRGIEHFDRSQHAFYFGRDLEIQDLTARLETDRFVAVVGGSGSGKSSLVRAGLSTDAAERALPGIREWHRIVFVPEKSPLLQLAAHLVAHLAESDRPALVQQFIEGFAESDGLITALTMLYPNRERSLLIVVDQFEELFTQRPVNEADQDAWRTRTTQFAANLRAAVEDGPSWLRVVVTLRADFLDRFVRNEFPELRTLIERRQFWVTPMSEEDIREVIVKPATMRGAFFEKGLVERILIDMENAATALPLLEEALDILWDKRRGPWLVHQAYDEIDGVGGALAGKANRIFDSLTDSQQAIARRVFLKLIQLGEGDRDTRRRVVLSELSAVTDALADFSRVLDAFSRRGARLISLSAKVAELPDSGQSEATVEVTHEALIDHWDRLRSWLNERRDDLRLDRRLTESAQRWRQETMRPNGKPRGLLWRPPELDLARDFVAREQGSVSALQMRFIKESRRVENARKFLLWASASGLLFALLVFGSVYLISIAPPDVWERISQPDPTEEYERTLLLPVHDVAISRKDPSVILYLGRNAHWETATFSITPSRGDQPNGFQSRVVEMLRSAEHVNPVARVTFNITSYEGQARGRGTMVVSAAMDDNGELRFTRHYEFFPHGDAKPSVVSTTLLGRADAVFDLGEYAEYLATHELLGAEDTITGVISDYLAKTTQTVEYVPDDLLADGYQSRQDYWGPEYKIFSNVDAEKLKIGRTTLAQQENQHGFWSTITSDPDWATYRAPTRTPVYSAYSDLAQNGLDHAASVPTPLRRVLLELDWNHDAVEVTMFSTRSPAGHADVVHVQWIELLRGGGSSRPNGEDWILRIGESESWKRVKFPATDVVGMWSLENDGRSALLLSAGRGLYRTSDGGVTWQPANYNETGFTDGTKVKPIVVRDADTTFALIDRGTTADDGENPLFRLKHRSIIERWRSGLISLLR